MTEVVIYRRIKTNWGLLLNDQNDMQITCKKFMPEFVPGTLFGELNLPSIHSVAEYKKKTYAEEEKNL